MGVIYKYKAKKNNLENSNNNNNISIHKFNDSKNNSIQIVNLNKYNFDTKRSFMKDYSDLSPFYYISNGNKVSKNMWGYNDKIKYRNIRNKFDNPNSNFSPSDKEGLTKEEIIQNKLKIFKDKIYKPFWEKVEKEKKNEFKRIQILKKINDPQIRENLETKFAIDRGKIDLELTQEKDKINKAIKNYEDNLLLGESVNKPNSRLNIFFE